MFGWITPGLLPGDFSAALTVGPRKIGVIGLNTAFLQLTGDDYKGGLDIHTAQITSLCGTDHQDWFSKHDLCVLLTHHPVDWFSEYGKEHLKIIAPPGSLVAFATAPGMFATQ